MDVQRLRGPLRYRGERLPRRDGRAAPHGATRHLRSCPQHDASAVDLCPARRARHGPRRPPPRSRRRTAAAIVRFVRAALNATLAVIPASAANPKFAVANFGFKSGTRIIELLVSL